MPLDILYSKPGHLIRRAHQIAVALFMEECISYDITPVQYAALVAIKETPGIAATQLSAIVAFDPATLGKVIERLEAKKLVSRRTIKADKRAKCLFLTREGNTLVESVEPAVLRSQERILAPLGMKDRKAFVRLLDRMVETNNHASRAPRGPMKATTRRRPVGQAS
jgi:DNA-binding MarR family transcriptional regulator